MTQHGIWENHTVRREPERAGQLLIWVIWLVLIAGLGMVVGGLAWLAARWVLDVFG